MIQLLMCSLDIRDAVVTKSDNMVESFQANTFDCNSVVNTKLANVVLNQLSKKRLKSDGLSGIVANNTPVSARVVILQEINGLYTEVGRGDSIDGSWEIGNLPSKPSIAIALKSSHNAGVVSGLDPKD